MIEFKHDDVKIVAVIYFKLFLSLQLITFQLPNKALA